MSFLTLGCMNFGFPTPEDESLDLIDTALDAGVNFLDTANVYNRGRNEKVLQANVNLAYNPATGVNLPYNVRANRPYPNHGIIGMTPFTALHDYHALQATFTKRMSNNWQAGATYSLAGLKSGEKREIKLTAPDTHPNEQIRGKEVTVELPFAPWAKDHGYEYEGIQLRTFLPLSENRLEWIPTKIEDPTQRAAIAVDNATAAICFSVRPGAPCGVSTLPILSFRSRA